MPEIFHLSVRARLPVLSWRPELGECFSSSSFRLSLTSSLLGVGGTSWAGPSLWPGSHPNWFQGRHACTWMWEVCSLTQFFSVYFFRQINDPLSGRNAFLFRRILCPRLDPWRPDTAPFKGPQPCLVCCFQNFRETRKSSAILWYARGHRTPSNTTDANHDCVFVKSTL